MPKLLTVNRLAGMVAISASIFFAYVQAAEIPEGVVAAVNGVQIMKSQLDREMNRLGLVNTPNLTANVRQQLIVRELLRQEASRHIEYEQAADVKDAVRDAHDLAIIKHWLVENVKVAPVGEDQVLKKYQDLIAELGDNEFKVRIIRVANVELAEELSKKLKQGADFSGLAKEFSTANNAKLGGEMGWLSFKVPIEEGKTHKIPASLARAISITVPGQIAGAPVMVGTQFYLVKVDAIRPTQVPTYEASRSAIRQQLEAAESERATEKAVSRFLKEARVLQ